MTRQIIIIFLFLCICLYLWPESSLPVNKIKLPPGFKISVYADHVNNAREMAFSQSGILYVGSMGEGKVYALIGSSKTHKADKIVVIASGLQMPVGVAYYKGDLYVSAVSKILRFEDIDNHLDNPPKPVVVNDTLPRETWHGWKFIRFGPDGLLYVPIGAPCNICLPEIPHGTITRMNPEGKNFEIYASGIRNSVGFDWRPVTKELWFTDNGRDYMGDNLPPDELNNAPEKGMFFGYPYVHGKNIYDPEFKNRIPDNFKFTPPEMELGPHVASLGMRFYTGNQFPKEYKNQIFIAEHGSWNRSVPIGYRVTLVRLDPAGKHAVSYEVFASGWFEGNTAWGRPADVEIGPDGALYISDDKAGAIYRVTYEPDK